MDHKKHHSGNKHSGNSNRHNSWERHRSSGLYAGSSTKVK